MTGDEGPHILLTVLTIVLNYAIKSAPPSSLRACSSLSRFAASPLPSIFALCFPLSPSLPSLPLPFASLFLPLLLSLFLPSLMLPLPVSPTTYFCTIMLSLPLLIHPHLLSPPSLSLFLPLPYATTSSLRPLQPPFLALPPSLRPATPLDPFHTPLSPFLGYATISFPHPLQPLFSPSPPPSPPSPSQDKYPKQKYLITFRFQHTYTPYHAPDHN